MSRRVLLVVDDEPRIRTFLREAFADEATRVEEARCSEEALAITESLVPDLILLDLRMPRRSGLHTLACLRRRPQLAYVPIMMLTAMPDAASVTAAFAAGADDFLAKPFDMATLEAKVTHWLADGVACRHGVAAGAPAGAPAGVGGRA